MSSRNRSRSFLSPLDAWDIPVHNRGANITNTVPVLKYVTTFFFFILSVHRCLQLLREPFLREPFHLKGCIAGG